MPIPYNVSVVLTYFQRRIEAYDIELSIVNHEAVQKVGDKYSFIGVLIPPTDKDLQLFDEGELAQGAMTVYVNKKVKLHVADALTNENQTSKQTIILFDGDEYRIKGYSNRSDDGIHRKYTMVRYIKGRI